MSTIVPPLPGPVTTPAPAGPQLLTVATGSLPDALAAGPAFDATVLPPQPGQPRGLLEVSTPAGPLILRGRGDLSLPAGATLTLQPTGGDGVAGLRLVAVNGRMLPGLLPLPPSGGAATPPGGPLASGLPPPVAAASGRIAAPVVPAPAVLAPGAVPSAAAGITATLLRPAALPAPGTADAQLPVLPPGTRLIVRIAGLQPSPQTAPAGAPTIEAAGAPGLPAAATEPAALPHAPMTPAQSLLAAAPAELPSAVSLPPSSALPPVLGGTVTAHAPGNQALVSTPLGVLALPVADELPVGAGLTLDVVSAPLPPETGTVASGQPHAPGLGPNGWPALADAAAALVAADDMPAMQELVRLLPQVGPQLAANLSLFANALRTGEVRTVFGPGVARGLEKAGRRDLARQLEDDIDALAEDAGRPVGNGEWRGFTLPLVYGGTIDPIHLYVRRPPDGEDEDSAAAGGRRGDERRFLLEVSMSRLGRLQMDGLVQRESKRFDLIIRTGQPLPEDMRRDILGLFAASSDAVGTQGTVTFQPGGRFVDLPPPPPPGTSFSV